MLDTILIIVIFILIALLVLIINGNPFVSKMLNLVQKDNLEDKENVLSRRSPTPHFTPRSSSKSHANNFIFSAPSSGGKNIKNFNKPRSQHVAQNDFNSRSSQKEKSIKNVNELPVFQPSKEANLYSSKQNDFSNCTAVSNSSSRNIKNRSCYTNQNSNARQKNFDLDEKEHFPKHTYQQQKQSNFAKNNFEYHVTKKENSPRNINELPIFQPSEEALKPNQTNLYYGRKNSARNYKLRQNVDYNDQYFWFKIVFDNFSKKEEH